MRPLIFIFALFLLATPATAVTREGSQRQVQRIISLGPINTENVFLLGAGERLVGNTSYCVRPDAARTIEKIGSVMQFSIEKIISLHPDLVLATGLTRPEQVQTLRDIGIKTVHFPQPGSFTEICDQFLLLGRMLGLEERAREIVNRAVERVNRIKQSVADLPLQKVFLQVGAQPLFSSTENSFTNDFIILSGGENIAGKNRSGLINPEQVIAKNPEVIIIAVMGSENGTAANEKRNWQRIPVIHAVENNRVHVINPDLVCSPSPATFASTLTIIASLIHPGLDLKTSP